MHPPPPPPVQKFGEVEFRKDRVKIQIWGNPSPPSFTTDGSSPQIQLLYLFLKLLKLKS